MFRFNSLAGVARINVVHTIFSDGGPVYAGCNSVDSAVVTLVSCGRNVVCLS